ncbi:Rz1 family lipoprotein [Providencia sp. R33]|nr:Rz1 family lipoprotein [Providencia sp. R33]
MQKLKLTSCVLMLAMALSACGSKPNVQAPKTVPPPAWMLADPPPWRETLSKIISISLNSLKLSKSNTLV